jgi:hypothetical protein
MTKSETLDEIWESVNNSDDFKNNFENQAPKLVELLILSLLENLPINIGLFFDGNDDGASIAYDIYNTDKILELRLKRDLTFELFVALENDEEGCLDFYRYCLTDDEVNIIPLGLRNLMEEVMKSEKEMAYQIDSRIK